MVGETLRDGGEPLTTETLCDHVARLDNGDEIRLVLSEYEARCPDRVELTPYPATVKTADYTDGYSGDRWRLVVETDDGDTLRGKGGGENDTGVGYLFQDCGTRKDDVMRGLIIGLED